ncbi:flagellar export chaperone FliS [Bacillus sp. DNRA2]|uniref:flagellar export chaperone FliS n=1 Tax=Bacillus sp. DNRA2 TaxID=2723053 RepID=UPI00145DEC2A|nr:flagellar export chaperone FliS [Bacillus sp. DNRA2]NMD69085.1 flagellar export chaperone FliS [Bacillus sp. DNRA2]
MVTNNPYQTYQRQAVTTSRPEELTLMLYQGLVKFIRLAKIDLENNNIEGSHKHNLRAQDIITELMVTLKTGYEISESLLSMYDFMKSRLIEANLTKKVELLVEVEGFAVELLETWSEAIKLNKTKL